MADSKTLQQWGIRKDYNVACTMQFKAASAIAPNDLVSLDASGNIVPAEAEQYDVIGVAPDRIAANNIGDVIVLGPCVMRAEAPVTVGQPLAAGNDGGAQPLVQADVTGTTIHTSAAGAAFTNQPANDGVTAVSDNAGDTTQTVTIYGTTNGTDTVVVETLALNGTTDADSSKTDWGVILGVELSASCAGTVEISETSGGLEIVSITTGNLSAGVETVSAGYAYNVEPTAVAGGASTKQVGLVGTDANGATIYDSQALNGTTAVTMNTSFNTITKVLDGDIAAGTATTVKVGAIEVTLKKVGLCLETQATAGGTFRALLGH